MKKVLIVHAIEQERISLVLPEVETKVIFSGIGKTNAAMNLMQAALEYQPDYVLNIGSAGTSNHQVGDIIVSHTFVDRDLERMKLFGLADHIQTIVPEDLCQLSSMVAGNAVVADFIVNTGDDFVTSGESITGDAIDMESFAEAMVCSKLGIPMLSVKYITDVVGQNSVALWEEKLADARAALTAYFEHAFTK